MQISESSSRVVLLEKKGMGSTPSQPKASRSNPAKRPAGRSRTKDSITSNESAADRTKYNPLQSTGNPSQDVRIQSPSDPRLPPNSIPFAASHSQKRVAPVRASPQSDADRSRAKHTPLDRRDTGSNSKRSSRSSVEIARTPEGMHSYRSLKRTLCWI